MKYSTFEPINYKKLSLLIENSIKDRILEGEFPPGSRLPNEFEIGKQFGVSLVTVREALKGLETFGLIEKRKGKGGGIFVAEPRSDYVKTTLFHFLNHKKFTSRDLSELRMIIEPVACKIATKRISETEIAKLERNIGYCESLIERTGGILSKDDFFRLEESNIEFHSIIGEATQNPVLVLTMDYVLDFMFSFKKTTLVPSSEFSNSIIKDHKLILDQLKKRKGASAEKMMVSHLKNVEYYLKENVKENQGADDGLLTGSRKSKFKTKEKE